MARVWRSAAIVDQLPWLEVEAAAEGVADEALAELAFDELESEVELAAVVLSVAELAVLPADEDEDEPVSEAEASSVEVLASAEALRAKTPARARVALTAAAATVVRARAAGWGRREAGRAGRGFVWSMTISFGSSSTLRPKAGSKLRPTCEPEVDLGGPAWWTAAMTGRTASQRAEQALALGRHDLVLSTLTIPRAGFEERVAAAAGSGYAGIGMHLGSYRRLLRDGWTIPAMAAALDRHDQLLVEIEFLQLWAGPPESEDEAAEQERLAFELADGLGARHLQLGGPYHGPVERAAEAFAGLCDRAAERGVLVSLEYLPEMTNVESSAQALAIAGLADRPNGGICVDAWHHERGPDTLADLAAIDGARVTSVQMDDGPAVRTEADYVTDTSTNRMAPGEGGFDLVGLIRTLDGLGVDAPLGLEVISPSLAASGPPAAVARRCADGMRGVLAQARGRS